MLTVYNFARIRRAFRDGMLPKLVPIVTSSELTSTCRPDAGWYSR